MRSREIVFLHRSRHRQGQALVELLLICGSVLTVFILALPSLTTAMSDRHHSIDSFRGILLQPVIVPAPPQGTSILVSSDYQMRRTLGLVLQPLTRLMALKLPFENLYQTSTDATQQNHGRIPKLAVLRESWSASSASSLRDDPAALVPTSYMQRVGIQYVQQAVAWLPNAREFGPTHLKIGHVDDEVVPEGALCSGRWLC